MENVTIPLSEYKDLIRIKVFCEVEAEYKEELKAAKEDAAKYKEYYDIWYNEAIRRQDVIDDMHEEIDDLKEKLAFYQPYSPEAESVKTEDVW